MLRYGLLSILTLIASGAIVSALTTAGEPEAHEAMKMPEPQKEHEWLRQLLGEWEADVETGAVAGHPATKSRGTEVARGVGGFWVVCEMKGTLVEMPFHGMLTLGYDPGAKKYVATWVDSMGSHLWRYEGAVDASGKSLILETEGPCPMAPGKMSRFREVIAIQGKDARSFTSSMLGDDGTWTRMVTVKYRRKS